MPIDEEQTVAPHLPRARPALFALAASVAVSLAMITGTIVLANRNTARTTELVENSLQSVQLVGQLRSRVFQLDTASPPEREVLVAQIATALDAYRPIAMIAITSGSCKASSESARITCLRSARSSS